MAKALVVYGTKSGCTKGIAEAIGDGLRLAGADADVFAADERPDPSAYDAVIVGSGIRAGMWHASAKQWLVGHAEALKTRPLALFALAAAIPPINSRTASTGMEVLTTAARLAAAVSPSPSRVS